MASTPSPGRGGRPLDNTLLRPHNTVVFASLFKDMSSTNTRPRYAHRLNKPLESKIPPRETGRQGEARVREKVRVRGRCVSREFVRLVCLRAACVQGTSTARVKGTRRLSPLIATPRGGWIAAVMGGSAPSNRSQDSCGGLDDGCPSGRSTCPGAAHAGETWCSALVARPRRPQFWSS